MTVPIDGFTSKEEVMKRTSFHKFQMDILWKTAEAMQIPKELEDVGPVLLYPARDFSLVTWRMDYDMKNEFYPHQIV